MANLAADRRKFPQKVPKEYKATATFHRIYRKPYSQKGSETATFHSCGFTASDWNGSVSF